jgi:hypothetical protein
MARVAAVNGLTIPQLLEYAGGTPSHSQILHVDYDASRSLIAGLAQACRISQDSLAEINLRVQLPNAPASLFLPVVHNVRNGYKRSAIAIPSCHACLGHRERMGTTPYWKVEWALALVSRCPKHLARLSEYCRHCLLGMLSLGVQPKHGGLVVRCTACFQATAFHPLPDPPGSSPLTQLVAIMGQALASACQGLDPDPMWLGPVDAALFLSVVDDLIWFFMDGNLDGGYPLVGQHAPATDSEMSAIRRTRWQRPLNLLTVRQREMVAAVVAIALLGTRITERFELDTRFPVPVSKLDSYPFSSVMRSSMRDRSTEIAERIARWPMVLKERALRYLPTAVRTSPRPGFQRT